MGFASTYDFVTKDLGYEPASAMRRITAALVIREIPEIKEKIADRSLSLSVISQAQSFLRRKAKDSGQKISIEEKVDLYKKLENKSARETEKELFKIAPELCLKFKEKETALSENLTELKFVIDAETKAKMDELKLWMSHQNPTMTQAEFFKIMVEKLHGQMAKKKMFADSSGQKITQSTSDAETGTSAAKNRSRNIPSAVKRQVWQRDQGCCQYVNAQTRKKCGSRYQVQFDHVHPFRHLGDHSAENLRLLCGKHNRYRD